MGIVLVHVPKKTKKIENMKYLIWAFYEIDKKRIYHTLKKNRIMYVCVNVYVRTHTTHTHALSLSLSLSRNIQTAFL
jgi:hypothetical protein